MIPSVDLVLPRLPVITTRAHGESGPELVVLHGGPGAPGSARSLSLALSARFRVLEPLQRWSGSLPLSVAQHVADLADVAPARAPIVGHSWGAMLALSYAATFPARVSAIVLIGMGEYGQPSRDAYQRAFYQRASAAQIEQLRALAAARERAVDDAERDAIRTELGLLAAEVMTFDALGPPDYERFDARGSSETWDDALRLQRDGIEPARFAAIDAPVLMLHGEQDPHPGPLTRVVLRAHIPQLEYLVFPQCGHDPWRERHARAPFLRAVFDWLGAH